MPKLTQQTLEKRFQCPHCGVTFRTRQGLSGHIQFRHPKVTTGTGNKSFFDEVVKAQIQRRSFSEPMGMSDAELDEMAEIQADWHFIKEVMKRENIKFSDIDYKTYLFVAAAFMYGNQRLMNKLNKELSSLNAKLAEISAKMASKS